VTASGGTVAIDGLHGLAGALRGTLLVPGDAGYDEARTIWNGEVDLRPPAIARCAGAGDVAAVVRFAAERGLPVAVRGGGHGVVGHALCEDGIVADLSGLRRVHVDPGRRIAHVGGGALWADVDGATQAHGLATTGAITSRTGVGGLTLGGGLGHLMRRCGLAVDNLVDADVVTADGHAVRVDATRDSELLWALRGGGGNFGAVTRFGLRLHEVGPTVLAGMVIHPLDAAPALLAHYRDVVGAAPDELGTVVNLRLCPPVPTVPARLHGAPVAAMVVCWTGDPDGARCVRALRAFGRPVLDTVTTRPYAELQRMSDATVRPGNHYYWRAAEIDRLTDEVVAILVEHAARITSPISAMPIFHLGGAVGRVAADATAYGSRAARHNVEIFAGWPPGDDRERHVAWVRGLGDALAPYTTGRYVNWLSDEGEQGVREAYGPDGMRRLAAVKRRVDPHNLYRHNHNIAPATGIGGASCASA
jgi:FAD/FMN-containing dehydrogenase